MSLPQRFIGGLSRNRHFSRLLGATGISELGTEVSNLAMPLTAITVLRASIFEVALLSACSFIPPAAFGLFAGTWVDRVRRRPLMIGSDVIRAAALATVPGAWALGGLTMLQLYVVALIVSTLNVLFDVAKQSYLPAVVDRDQLGPANAQLQLAEQGAAVAGPGLGGLLIAAIGAPFAVAVDAVSYLGSAGLIAGVKHLEIRASAPGSSGILSSIKEGIRFVLGHDYLRPLALSGAGVGFFARMLSAVLLVYLAREAGLGAASIGLVMAVAGVGFVLGALIAPAAIHSLGLGRGAALGLIGAGVGLLIIAAAPPQMAGWSTAIGMFVYGTAAVLWQVSSVTLRQQIAPSAMLGRVTATMRVILTVPVPVAAIAGGSLGQLLGLRTTLLLAATGGMMAALSIVVTKVPRYQDLPPQAEGEDKPKAA